MKNIVHYLLLLCFCGISHAQVGIALPQANSIEVLLESDINVLIMDTNVVLKVIIGAYIYTVINT